MLQHCRNNNTSIHSLMVYSFYNDHSGTMALNSFLESRYNLSLSLFLSLTHSLAVALLKPERTVGSHSDRLRLARSNLPEMRSGNRLGTPTVRIHERGKS